MTHLKDINRHDTYNAIMQRRKEDIADQLAGILTLLYNDMGEDENAFKAGWNAGRACIRDIFNCDNWVKWEGEK